MDEKFYDIAYIMLSIDEGVKAFAYDDATGYPPYVRGKLTIGIGRNLTDRGLSPDEINFLFKNDVKSAVADSVSIFPKFPEYSLNRQLAIVNLLFNLGKTRFLLFHDTIHAITEERWDDAAICLQDSLWYSQVKNRALKIVNLLKE